MKPFDQLRRKIFTFELSGPEDTIVLDSPEAVDQFVEREKAAWGWIFSTPNFAIDGPRKWVHDSLNEIGNHRGNIANYELPQIVFPNTQPPGITKADTIRNALAAYNRERFKIFSSLSVIGRFILGLSAKSNVKLGAYVYLGKFPFRFGSDSDVDEEIFEGMFRAALWEAGLEKSQPDIYSKLLDGFVQKVNAHTSELESHVTELISKNSDVNEKFSEELAGKSTALDTLQNEKRESLEGLYAKEEKRFEELYKKVEIDLAKVIENHEKFIALSEPRKYWAEKKKNHTEKGARTMYTGLLVAGLIFAAIVYFINTSIAVILQGDSTRPAAGFDLFRTWQFYVLIACSFFSIWILRLFVRSYLSHSHLAADAHEREVMVQTFISLARESDGQILDKENQKIFYQNIFRPSSDGLVRDDAAPPTPMEIITRNQSS